jgi:DNA (cytosine-5)-methyltransferase 1
MKNSRIRAKQIPYTAVDLFSGCGGLSLGLRNAGFNVLAAVEIDAKAQSTYKLNHPRVRLYESDIRRLSPIEVLNDLGLERGKLDLLAGCPPCQGFSRLRTKNQRTSVRDDRNNLIFEFLRFVEVMRPKTVMFENVPGLVDDHRFKKMRDGLTDFGYGSIVEILNAADYNVAQRRQRLILLASKVHTPKIAQKSRRKPTVRNAFEGVGAPSASKDKLHAMPENRSQKVRDLIARIPKNGGSRGDLPDDAQLDCHKKCAGFRDVYGRMSWDAVAPTITSGCNNPSKGRFIHPSYNRAITLREAALLQGFPHDYQFDTKHGKSAISLMIGNALPPPFIAAHARALSIGLDKSSSFKA